MAREKPPKPDTSGEVPPWFMTYSDVITLLMTFFILLLTFASHEPEQFERVKASMFGAGGSPGFAGEKTDSLDRESVVKRFRPEVARLTPHGSERAPSEQDPTRNGMSEGLKALDEESDLAQFQRPTFEIAKNNLLKSDGQLTDTALRYLKMMSRQIAAQDMKLSILTPNKQDSPAGVEMAYRMWKEHGVKLGSVSVGTQVNPARNTFVFTLIRKTASIASQ